MWKSEKTEGVKGAMGDAVKGRRGDAATMRPRVLASPRLPVFLLLIGLLLTTGCRRDMQDQPKMKPYRGTTFFNDGLSARQPIPGTVPRGFLRIDTEYFTGKKSGSSAATPDPQNPFAGDTDTFPFAVTEKTVERGRERYDIFCSVCHGMTGNGDGMIVRRGFRRAASFNDDRLRQAPVGHYFDAITNGWGAMPSYAAQIPVQDRWAIVAYIRALQLSQQNPNAQPGASPVPGATPGPVASPAASPGASPSPRSGGHD